MIFLLALLSLKTHGVGGLEDIYKLHSRFGLQLRNTELEELTTFKAKVSKSVLYWSCIEEALLHLSKLPAA